MYKTSAGEKAFDGVNILLLVIIAATMIFPFLYIFAVSFSSLSDFLENDLLLWPKEWVTDAYTFILGSDQFIRSIFVTIYITVVGTFVNLFFTSTMAYALTRGIYGQRTILFLVLFTMLFSAGMIPTYMIVKATGLLNTWWALIIPVAISPFNLIIMRQFFLGIPEELKEAAIIDGANDIQIFTKVILPLSKPALAAFGLFYAVSHWNSYFTGVLYLSDPAKWPIQVILRQIVIVNEPNAALGAHEMMESLPPPETVQMAAILLATIPILIVYPFLQKHFAKGVMLGSVKG
ncbi:MULTISPECIES: carbohydrate ABC transporter permease [unclassified Mesobacillus]|uniref:carbohydrate ABC transporter permease n=1 Tax=unclassified Mesobacillus TaxID=2675270 RepID=UPI00203E81AC|nr:MULTISPECIES: carbohydrate ABC transporter permease [unclassified Mesobacillus]MCM3123846.1 carbohydrate ABC transporter permease [Mesobacillus sp. MER 33]MCM3234139.1 carbohydrate ABC transporter permease [Mesobacillus sp. MER 48]